MQTLLGAAVVVLTEALGAAGQIRRGPLRLAWSVLAVCRVIAWVRKSATAGWPSSLGLDPCVLLCAAACMAIAVITGVIAWFSPPNSVDAMAYHLPRVVYWAQQASVRFFPTPHLNQIMLQPFAEYVQLHLYVLSNGDRFANLVRWFAALLSVVAVSYAGHQLGMRSRGRAIAAVLPRMDPLRLGLRRSCVRSTPAQRPFPLRRDATRLTLKVAIFTRFSRG